MLKVLQIAGNEKWKEKTAYFPKYSKTVFYHNILFFSG